MKGTSTKREKLVLSEDELPSTKMRAVLEHVQKIIRKGGPRPKVVVFSQFVQFLDLLQDYLSKDVAIKIARIDGSVSRAGREFEMSKFNSPGGTANVMLASLMAAGVGINLLGAASVIICDPWWNPATENQVEKKKNFPHFLSIELCREGYGQGAQNRPNRTSDCVSSGHCWKP